MRKVNEVNGKINPCCCFNYAAKLGLPIGLSAREVRLQATKIQSPQPAAFSVRSNQLAFLSLKETGFDTNA